VIDFDIIAYAMLGLSLSVSAVQLGGWLLHAQPRAILNAGRWSAVALAAMTPLVLLWLAVSGRATLAMMLAAFALPAFIEGARRWRGTFPRPLLLWGAWRSARRAVIDRALAAHCAAVLQAYLEQTAAEAERDAGAPRRLEPRQTGAGQCPNRAEPN
jgi:hypothetical protein